MVSKRMGVDWLVFIKIDDPSWRTSCTLQRFCSKFCSVGSTHNIGFIHFRTIKKTFWHSSSVNCKEYHQWRKFNCKEQTRILFYITNPSFQFSSISLLHHWTIYLIIPSEECVQFFAFVVDEQQQLLQQWTQYMQDQLQAQSFHKSNWFLSLMQDCSYLFHTKMSLRN